MASMTVRNIDEEIKSRLRMRAARRGHSMQAEARYILRAALSSERSRSRGLVESIRARIEPLGGIELDIPWVE